MNLNFKTQSVVGFVFKIAIIFALAKGAWIGVLFYLQKNPVDKIEVQSKSFYDKYRLSKAFGIAQVVQSAAQIKQAEVLKLDNIELQGVFASKELSFVTIKDANIVEIIEKNANYKGFVLKEVNPFGAIFEKDGLRYELLLDKEKMPQTIKPTQIMGDDVVRFVPRKEVKSYTGNIQNIWKQIGIKEIVEKGKLQGFRVTRVEPGSVFEKLGLAKEDIIIGANNKIFVTYSEVLEFYKNMDKIDSIKLIFKRDNQQKELEYEIY